MLTIGVYSGQSEKDFFLPQSDTWVTALFLDKTEMGLDADVSVPVRALQRQCYMSLPAKFRWLDGVAGERQIEVGQYIMTDGVKRVSFVVSQWEPAQLVFEKYVFPVRDKVTIGRSDRNTIWLDEALTTGDHGYFERLGQNAIYVDTSTNGTYINGRHTHQATHSLSFGDVLLIPPGLKLVYLGSCLAINHPKHLQRVSLTPIELPAREEAPAVDEDTYLSYVQYHRVPRILKMPDNGEVEIEPPLAKQQGQDQPLWLTLGPSMTMVLPMMMGSLAMAQTGSGFMISGLVMVGTSAVLATTWGFLNYRHRKKSGIVSEKKRIALYRKYLNEMETQLKERATVEMSRLRHSRLSAEECLCMPNVLDSRMWGRMPNHDDFLFVRMGLGKALIPGEIKIQPQKLSLIDDALRKEPQRLKKQYEYLHNAPVGIALRQLQMVGVLGGEEAKKAVQGMVLQIAALHSYNDVKICILTEEAEYEEWKWARFLPHVYPTVDRNMRMFACKPNAVCDVLNYLYEVLGTRIEMQREKDANKETTPEGQPLPHYVIVCTNPALLESQQMMRHLLKGYYGMTLVLMTPSLEGLPKECRLIVSPHGKKGSIFGHQGDVQRLHFDIIQREWLFRFAKDIAPVRVNDIEESAAIPSYVTFLESYHVKNVKELDVWRFWNENMTYNGLKSVVGLKAGSEPFVLDISEHMHGPHGLVAGTTGSGKSVMLQTYILSLALNYSPKQVQFALIDYKGGGMANTFKALPHIAGIISDIQGEQDIARALASVQGEIERRKYLLAETGTENVDEFNRMFHNSGAEDTIPHLIIVVDEFAELRREKPEFMKELVTAARVGRSLGIHLILSTQKPSNSVDDEIWSNTRFRLCLRVASRGDSIDMLKRPDAAYLKGMGRCYVQVGSDELFEQVQTCYSGAAYAPNDISPEQRPRLLNEVGRPITIKGQKKHGGKEYTQMDAVLEWISTVAEKHGIAAAKRLWKNRLSSSLYLHQLEDHQSAHFDGSKWPVNATGELCVQVGYADDVNRQRYIPFQVNITSSRNYLFVGMPQSGKTIALQTIAMALCEKYSPQDVQFYIFSLSSKTLGTLGGLCHVGGVVYEDEPEEQIRMLHMIERENATRKQLMSRASTDSYLEYLRAADLDETLPRVPAIIVLVDRLFQAKELLGEDYFERLSVLLREGSSRGIFFIATALSMAEVPWKIQSAFTTVALENPARGDYTDILGQRIPAEMADILHAPGRGIAKLNDELMEIQLAVFNAADQPLSDAERAQHIAARSAEMSAAWKGPLPVLLPRIPEKPTCSALLESCQIHESLQDALSLPLGYRVLEGAPFVADLWNDFAWLAIGPSQSGRTSFLRSVAWMMGRRGADMLVVTDSPAEWKELQKQYALTVAGPDDDECMHFLEQVNTQSLKRKEQRDRVEGDSAQREAILSFAPQVILLDNLDLLQERMPKSEAFLANTCTRAAHFGVLCFATASTTGAFSGQLKPMMKAFIQRQCALVLRGKLSDCDVFPCQLNYVQKSVMLPPGHAYLVCKGTAEQLILPLCE